MFEKWNKKENEGYNILKFRNKERKYNWYYFFLGNVIYYDLK